MMGLDTYPLSQTFPLVDAPRREQNTALLSRPGGNRFHCILCGYPDDYTRYDVIELETPRVLKAVDDFG